MDWLDLNRGGSIASLLGLAAALVGLVIAYLQARSARRAANLLALSSGNRATTLIQQLKVLLHKGQWEVAYYQCHTLRALVGDLRMTGVSPDEKQLIDQAVELLTAIENDLDAGITEGREPKGASGYNAALSGIQFNLERMVTRAAARRGGPHV